MSESEFPAIAAYFLLHSFFSFLRNNPFGFITWLFVSLVSYKELYLFVTAVKSCQPGLAVCICSQWGIQQLPGEAGSARGHPDISEPKSCFPRLMGHFYFIHQEDSFSFGLLITCCI